MTREELDSRRYGRFVSAKGQVYPEFQEAVHVIEPFDVPREWYDNISIDPGLHNPLSCHFYATDGDGKLDLVKAVVQVPRAAAEGDYKAATIYEARPYITGCTNRGMGYDTADGYDMTKLYARPEARDSFLKTTTLEAAANVKSSDWYTTIPLRA